MQTPPDRVLMAAAANHGEWSPNRFGGGPECAGPNRKVKAFCPAEPLC
jgi:hypothetical protein